MLGATGNECSILCFNKIQGEGESCRRGCGSYRDASMQLARYAELRHIFTETYRADVDEWDVLDQALVHILDLAITTQM